MAVRPDRESLLEEQQVHLEEETRFLWYEFTPYEIGCDEIGGEYLSNTVN